MCVLMMGCIIDVYLNIMIVKLFLYMWCEVDYVWCVMEVFKVIGDV